MNVAPTRPLAPAPPAQTDLDPRMHRILYGPILPTLLRLAWPNALVMAAQASTGLIETWWLSRLGVEALTGMALVFPGFLTMTMLSAGAVGGGIASTIARSLGARRQADADALVLHGLVINLVLGLVTSAIFLVFGRPIYAAMGGEGASLDAALAYSNVVFGGNVLLWVANAFASVIRGTGNMLVPSVAICAGVVALVPLSPLLIFGLGPIPAMGVAGGGAAVVLTTALMLVLLGWYVLSGRCLARFRPGRLEWRFASDILRIGAVGSVNTLNTALAMALLTGIVGAAAGADAVAGFGTAARLEYLLIPLVFGLGAPLVALVGTNIGAGQQRRALRIALTGGAAAFAMTEAIGLAAAIWPEAWLRLFSDDPAMLASGASYLHWVGPTYGGFGLGLSLYFASQGAGRLAWPLLIGIVRTAIAVGGGALAITWTGSVASVFAAIGLALVSYGALMTAVILSGVLFRPRRLG